MSKLSLVLLSCILILSLTFMAADAKRSKKRSFIEEIVELADTERGGSFRMPTIAPMRMPTFTSFAPRIATPSFAPRMPTFTSFAPSYKMPSFSPSFAPMRMPSFAPMRMPSFAAPRMPSFAPMRFPSYSPMKLPSFAPRMNSFAPRLPTFASPRFNSFARSTNFGSVPRTPGWGRANLMSYAARGPSVAKPMGWGRVNLNNYANRFNARNPFGSLPSQPRFNRGTEHRPGWGRVKFMNYVNRSNGKNPFGALPIGQLGRNQFAGRNLPFFANNKFGRGPTSFGARAPASNKLPHFAREASFKGRPLNLNGATPATRNQRQESPTGGQSLSELRAAYNLGKDNRPPPRGIDNHNANPRELAKKIGNLIAGQLPTDPSARAAAIALTIANDAPKGKCAGYVAGSIEAGLGKSMNRPKATVHIADGIPSAKDYGPSLQGMGYKQIPNPGQPKIGDVQVIPGVKGHPDGHIQIYTAKGWVSDFNQGISSTQNPKSAYYGQTPTTYRY